MSGEQPEPPTTQTAARPPHAAPWRAVLALLVATACGVALGLIVPVNGRSPLAERLGLRLPGLGWPAERPAPADTSGASSATTPSPGAATSSPAAPAKPQRLEPLPIHARAQQAFVPILMYHDVVDGQKGVWFDATTTEFDRDLAAIEERGVTPISLAQWWAYLTRGEGLPARPVLLTFDDGYASVYQLIYPRLKKRRWPAVFFITTSTVGRKTGKDHMTWDQMREMKATGLFEFQAHTVTHPELTKCSDSELANEITKCRDTLQQQLDTPIQFLCYPSGDRDPRVIDAAKAAGFVAGFTMSAGGSAQSPGPMEVNRYPCQKLALALEKASCKLPVSREPQAGAPTKGDQAQPVLFHRDVLRLGKLRVPLCWVTGGRLTSVHADFRYGVPDVARLAKAPAGINGGFFQMAHLRDVSNAMLGPVMSQWTTTRNEELWRRKTIAEPQALVAYGRFVAGNAHDNDRLRGRPLVLISRTDLRFVPFDPARHNSQLGLDQALPGVTDAFVGGGWLVRDGQALDAEAMDQVSTRDHKDPRRRAFCGVDHKGRPVIGASPSSQSSVTIARCLQKLGIVQAALLDSGFSSSLYYNGSIFVTGHSDEKPSRPVPHMLLLARPDSPATQALGQAAGRVEGQVRAAMNDSQSAELPPNSRLVDVDRPRAADGDGSPERPRRNTRRRR